MRKKSKTDSEIVEIKLQKYTTSVLKQAVGFLEIFLPKNLSRIFTSPKNYDKMPKKGKRT